MSNYLKPQSPLYHKKEDTYFYPLTTADQVILNNGDRLNTLFKKTIKENIILSASGWSELAPYIQTITLAESTDDYKVDANIRYNGDSNDYALNKAAACLTYIKKNNKEITFYCLEKKPEADIPIEISITCKDTIANITTNIIEGIKLNFDIKAYATEEELLADTPIENTIGVITDVEITGHYFQIEQPENMVDGEVWVCTTRYSSIAFNVLKKNTIMVYPMAAKQMVSGSLVDLNVKSYHNGEWVAWYNGELYTPGNEWVEVTGGWVARTWLYNYEPYDNMVPTVTSGPFCMEITTDKWYGSGAVEISKDIDFTDIKSLEIECEGTSTNANILLAVINRNQSYSKDSVASIQLSISNTRKKFTLDTSSIHGNYSVAILIYHTQQGLAQFKMYSLYAKKEVL